ncbi:MAG: lytic murein transglycosylase [Hydrogenophilus sp.]|nr:lytic murein transglycosylase [Hydrogenophilus sp.]
MPLLFLLLTALPLPLFAHSPPLTSAALQRCLADLAPAAVERGVSPELFAALTRRLTPDPKTLELLDRQPEFVAPLWHYLAQLLDRNRLLEARHSLLQHAALLRQIEAEYGVEAELIVAFWAIESNFGRNLGRFDLIRSLATLSCFGRRQEFFRNEFLTLTEIIARGEITTLSPHGSWAGAFGHTQFLPTTFLAYAVDGDGDGIRDLYHSLADVFASTANFLKKLGWRSGEPWGIEVRLPPHWKSTPTGRTLKRPTRDWLALGLTPLGTPSWPTPLPERAALLLPAGKSGPALLLFPNFDVIYRYNNAESYALAVALLYDLLKNPQKIEDFDPAQPFFTPWPLDAFPLTRSEILELQHHLAARGYDPGPIDGLFGPTTREAVRRFQLECQGDPSADGWPTLKLLQDLRAQTCVPPRQP